MPQHTPGPWGALSLGLDAPAGSNETYEVWAGDITPDQMIAVLAGENQEANALLIAAAPDLLTACEAMHARLFREQGGDPNSPWRAAVDMLRAAIAKATGQE